MRKRFRISSVMIAVALLSSGVDAKPQSLAQKSRPLAQKLQRPVTVTWQNQALATALGRLAEVGDVTLWLDRRTDRQLQINAHVTDLPLRDALETILQPHALDVAVLDNIIYIGPAQTAAELPVLRQRARKMLDKAPASVRRKWMHAPSVTWPRLSEPRALLTDWLDEASVECANCERIAHDLWPAQSLPATPLVDRVVVLLAGFDLTCEISKRGYRCAVVAIPRPLKRARQSSGLGEPASAGGDPQKTPLSQQRFTLRLKNQPLGPVLDQLAQQLDLELVWPDDETLRKRRVTCDVKNADLDELLREILKSAGMQHQRTGDKITVRSKAATEAKPAAAPTR